MTRSHLIGRKVGDPCSHCGAPITDETKMVRACDGTLFARCRPCKNAIQRAQRERDPARHRKDSRDDHHVARQSFLSMYGRTCACCGIRYEDALQIDHVKNDGAAHRKGNTMGSTQTYREACRSHRPDLYQTLCRNCNWGKSRSKASPPRCHCHEWR